MKQKILLLMMATLFAATSAWAQQVGNRGRGFLKDFSYNSETEEVTFTDLLSTDNEYRRQYFIEIFERTGNPEDGYKERKIFSHYYGPFPNFRTQTIHIGNEFDYCYKEGANTLRIYVSGLWIDPLSRNEPTVGIPTWYPDMYGVDEKNHFDLYIDPFRTREVAWGVTEDDYSTGMSSIDVDYGDDLRLSVFTFGINAYNYNWERSQDGGKTWQTCPNYTSGHEEFSGYVNSKDARHGQQIKYKYPVKLKEKPSLYRLYVQDDRNGHPSDVIAVNFRYPCTKPDGNTYMCKADSQFVMQKPKDCHEYKYTCELPVKIEDEGEYLLVTMPACPLTIEEYAPTYEVNFYDDDATLLKKEEVDAGEDATPPDMGGGAQTRSTQQPTFTGWSQDYTNVHRSLNVFARYDVYVDMGIDMVSHTCNRTEDWKFVSLNNETFEGNKRKAMVGDQMTFRASVKTNTPVSVYFQVGKAQDNGKIDWANATKVGEVTGYEVNKVKTFDREVTALVEYGNEMPFEKKRYYRFYAYGNGTEEKVYSEAMEIKMYYPTTIAADQNICSLSSSGFFFIDKRSVLPVQYGEEINFLDEQGQFGVGFNLARMNKPGKEYLTEGIEGGVRYFIGPGETETINVTTKQMTVVFEVPGQGKPEFKQYGNSAYDVQTVPYGDSAILPVDPEQQGEIFKGWKSWDDTEYPDDGYLCVKQDLIGFTAEFEGIPSGPLHIVIFKNYDDSVLDTQQVEEGENATPPNVPERNGYHFTGWDGSYTTVTQDLTLKALFGQDEVYHTVTYQDYDETELGTEQVLDGQAAAGMSPTRKGFTLTGWSEDISCVTNDMTVTAQYTETLWTVTFRVEGVITYSIQAVEGYNPASIYYVPGTPKKASTASTDYTFSHWAPNDVTAVIGDLTLDAVFTESPRKYTVIFQNWDHETIETQSVAYGTAATAPAIPKKEGYTFAGWDRDFSKIQAETTVTALFVKNDLITKGDANGDGIVDVADIVEMVNAMKGQPSANYKAINADIDGNGYVTDTDITEVVKIIMAK